MRNLESGELNESVENSMMVVCGGELLGIGWSRQEVSE